MIAQYLRISRPRFWLYLLGPFLIGAIAADTADFFWPALAVFAFYFTFPANMLLYGVNDIFDYETDQHNEKKRGYEALVKPADRWRIANVIVLWNLPFCVVWLADEMPQSAKLALLGFLFFGIFYSAKPIRAKTKPIFDSLFNILYIFPALFSYGLLEYKFPPWQIIAAGALWCAAMHAYSAIPDIRADKKAKINTVATFLRPLGTLVFCMLCFAGAAILTYPWLKVFSIAAGGLYVFIMLITFVRAEPSQIFAFYKLFPFVNILVGTGLFFYIALVVK
ncbi:prenyltransferase [Candidatus Saccharibacteria bacterium]|nr:prenyltransferase [Candidatus Saccharibacteria bacterium]